MNKFNKCLTVPAMWQTLLEVSMQKWARDGLCPSKSGGLVGDKEMWQMIMSQNERAVREVHIVFWQERSD